MRKITPAVVATAMLTAVALTLAGCTGGARPGPDTNANTLTISGWSGDETMAALIERFEEKHPGVEVSFTGLPWPGILTQINTELVSGTASDFVVVFPGNGNPITVQTLARGNFLEDLSSQDWVPRFSEVNRTVMGTDGVVMMGANNFTIIPAIYNSQALAEVGASAPTTWGEVLELCSTARDHGKVAYALAGLAGGTYNYLPYALTATLVYGPHPDFGAQQAAGEASFSDSEWSTALDKYLEMSDAGCFTDDALGVSLEVAQDQVADGGALGIVTVSNQIGDIQRRAPEGTTFETAALPATDNPAETILPVGLGAGYGVNAHARNKELALQFMEFYLSDEGINVALEAGSIYTTIDVEGFEPIPTLAGVADQVRSDRTAVFPDQTWPSSYVGRVYQDEIQKILGGQATVEQSLATMDTAYHD